VRPIPPQTVEPSHSPIQPTTTFETDDQTHGCHIVLKANADCGPTTLIYESRSENFKIHADHVRFPNLLVYMTES